VLPVQFYTLIESKLDDDEEVVYDYSWWLDMTNMVERVDYEELGVGASTRYTRVYSYNSEAMNSGTTYVLQNGACETDAISPINANPLTQIREGFIVALFRGTVGLNPTYLGRISTRAVSADVWRSPIVRIGTDGLTYTFNADIYFYPVGWQFPGRAGVNAATRIPLRIVTNGTASDGTSFYDAWDLFDFIPAAPDAALTNANLLKCVPPQPIDNGGGNNKGPSAGVIAAATLGAIGGVAFLVGVICFVRRFKKQNSPEEPIRLEETGPSS